MNQEQRKFLIEKIVQTHNKQIDEIKASVPEEPSFNNHLIGAFLQGTIKILDPKKIKENITKIVRNLEKEGSIVSEVEEDYGYSYRRNRKRRWKDQKFNLVIPPEAILELPSTYQKEFDEWKKIKDEADKKIIDLNNQKDLLILKIQVGSNQILDKLINQVDSLGDLDLFSNKLTLIAEGFDSLKLENKK